MILLLLRSRRELFHTGDETALVRRLMPRFLLLSFQMFPSFDDWILPVLLVEARLCRTRIICYRASQIYRCCVFRTTGLRANVFLFDNPRSTVTLKGEQYCGPNEGTFGARSLGK